MPAAGRARRPHVITEPEQLRTYECDGLTGYRALPALVVLPSDDRGRADRRPPCHASGSLRRARRRHRPLGGAVPVADGDRDLAGADDRVLEVDLDERRVVVEPGVTNLDVTRAVEADGFFYAPDPSSQQVCTIGGNVAENSGGAHCLKYGFTVNHVLGLELVLPDGEVVELGGRGATGPDLLGVFVGSEGTLGIATEVTLRIVRAAGGRADAAGRLPLDRRRRRASRGSSPPGSCRPRSR